MHESPDAWRGGGRGLGRRLALGWPTAALAALPHTHPPTARPAHLLRAAAGGLPQAVEVSAVFALHRCGGLHQEGGGAVLCSRGRGCGAGRTGVPM